MTKFEYMSELEHLLLDIPIEEREAALEYYDDYFEDAGMRSVDEIIEELGAPSKVAAIIKSDLSSSEGSYVTRGSFTESGYMDTTLPEEKYEICNQYEDSINKNREEDYQKNSSYSQTNNQSHYSDTQRNFDYEQKGSGQYERNNSSRVLLIILLCIFGFPVLFPLAASFFGIFIGIMAAIFGISLAFGIAGLTLAVVGIGLFIWGVGSLIVFPMNGILIIGAGLVLFGLGILFFIFAGSLFFKLLPGIIKGIAGIFQRLFHRSPANKCQ